MKATAIDWCEVYRRLDTARTALERGVVATPEAKKEILRERAQALAREAETEQAVQARLDMLEFVLAQEHYAVEARYVREVYPLKAFTPLPCTPPFVLGIINVRGRIVSILDLRTFFELPEKGLTDLNKVIILHDPPMEFGLLADEVMGARSVALADIQPPPPTLTGIRAAYLRGVTRERLAVLGAAKLLADNRLVVHEEVEG